MSAFLHNKLNCFGGQKYYIKMKVPNFLMNYHAKAKHALGIIYYHYLLITSVMLTALQLSCR